MRAFVRLLTPAALTFLVACPEDQVSRTFGKLEVTPLELDFGVVPLASTRVKTVMLANLGDAALAVTPAIAGAQLEGLRVDRQLFNLVPGETKVFEVSYVPE